MPRPIAIFRRFVSWSLPWVRGLPRITNPLAESFQRYTALFFVCRCTLDGQLKQRPRTEGAPGRASFADMNLVTEDVFVPTLSHVAVVD